MKFRVHFSYLTVGFGTKASWREVEAEDEAGALAAAKARCGPSDIFSAARVERLDPPMPCFFVGGSMDNRTLWLDAPPEFFEAFPDTYRRSAQTTALGDCVIYTHYDGPPG